MDLAKDGDNQVKAGKTLLLSSKLVLWDSEKDEFKSNLANCFEKHANVFDAHYGRVMCWVLFSAGCEYLAKGSCLLNDIRILKEHKNFFSYPPENSACLKGWIDRVAAGSCKEKRLEMTNYGMLGDLCSGPLAKLCDKRHVSDDDKKLLVASFRFLASTIRNRDAHAYVANVREQHFYVVEKLFVPSLNMLLRWATPDSST